MGYSYYDFEDGFGPRGYGVDATCDEPGCEKEIDRGMGYLCYGCTHYFCGDHLVFAETNFECFAGSSCQCCNKCADSQAEETEVA